MSDSKATSVTKTVTEADSYSNAFSVIGPSNGRKLHFNLAITGTAPITLQRSIDGGSTWQDIERFTASADRLVEDWHVEGTWQYRAGCKLGETITGSAAIVLCW